MSTDGFGASGSDAQQTLQSFWPRVMEEIRNLTVVGFTEQLLLTSRTVLKRQYTIKKYYKIVFLTYAECDATNLSRRTFVCRNCLWLESRKSWNWMKMWRYEDNLNYISDSSQMNSWMSCGYNRWRYLILNASPIKYFKKLLKNWPLQVLFTYNLFIHF